jgi:hypothetical protein
MLEQWWPVVLKVVTVGDVLFSFLCASYKLYRLFVPQGVVSLAR